MLLAIYDKITRLKRKGNAMIAQFNGVLRVSSLKISLKTRRYSEPYR